MLALIRIPSNECLFEETHYLSIPKPVILIPEWEPKLKICLLNALKRAPTIYVRTYHRENITDNQMKIIFLEPLKLVLNTYIMYHSALSKSFDFRFASFRTWLILTPAENLSPKSCNEILNH